MNNLSDKQLVEAIRRNDPWAFEALYNKYWAALFQTAYRKLQSEEDAKDIVQEVWLSLWRNIESINIENDLAPYLFTALRNKIIHFFRNNKVRLAYVTNQLEVNVKDTSEIQQHGALKELQSVLNEAVEEMPERMKEVYKLSRQTHLQVNEIAERLNISPQTVKNQLHNALKRLRKRLSQYDADLLILFFITCIER